ncbi:MAG: LytTR family transcriptional regulator DNA-binding domain-containing protein [Bacteroidales bacterium]|nr:LytTR family transcriptional regulator DNA-binding domain-containing protein [Bacteroidales bacterium]OJX88890.1 MAG: hypothetical protein BGP01_00895 [Paludibacter sp. 47-17]
MEVHKPDIERNRLVEVIVIAAVWIVVFTIPLFSNHQNGTYQWSEIHHDWLQLAVLFLIYIGNIAFIIPRYLHKKHYLHYLVVLLVALPLITCIELQLHTLLKQEQVVTMPSMDKGTPIEFSSEMPAPEGFRLTERKNSKNNSPDFWTHLLIALLVTGSAAAHKMLSYWIQEEKTRKTIENKLKRELSEPQPGFIIVKSDYKSVKLMFDDILYIESANEYVKIYLSGGEMIMTFMRLKNMENELPKDKFMRVQRSFIVNLEKIKAVEKNKIYIEHKKTIPIGEQYKVSFQEFLGKHFVK